MAAHLQLVDPAATVRARASEPEERREALNALRKLEEHDLPDHALRALSSCLDLVELYAAPGEQVV